MVPSRSVVRAVAESARTTQSGRRWDQFAAVHAAVLGDALPSQPQPGDDGDAGAGLEHYLFGLATGIEATGADREPISLVTGLIAREARLQFHRAGAAARGVSAASSPPRGSRPHADAAGDGADLAGVAAAAAGVGFLRAGQQDSTGTDARLGGLIALLLVTLQDVVVPDRRRDQTAGCGAEPGAPGGRQFLAEVTFGFGGTEQAADTLVQNLERMGTDLKVWGEEQDLRFHLHTVDPGAVVTEAYALGTVFDLRIGTLEPPPDSSIGDADF